MPWHIPRVKFSWDSDENVLAWSGWLFKWIVPFYWLSACCAASPHTKSFVSWLRNENCNNWKWLPFLGGAWQGPIDFTWCLWHSSIITVCTWHFCWASQQTTWLLKPQLALMCSVTKIGLHGRLPPCSFIKSFYFGCFRSFKINPDGLLLYENHDKNRPSTYFAIVKGLLQIMGTSDTWIGLEHLIHE